MSRQNNRQKGLVTGIVAGVVIGLIAVPITIRLLRRRRFLRHLDAENENYSQGYNDDINFDDGRRPLFNQYQDRSFFGRYKVS